MLLATDEFDPAPVPNDRESSQKPGASAPIDGPGPSQMRRNP